MAREKEAYRDNIAAMSEWLHNKYGDSRRMMSIGDVCEYLGRSYDFVRKHFGIPRMGVTIETLAWALS